VNAGGSVLGLVTGVGNTNAAATIMALGLDPRFDLTKSYWLIAGIPLSFSIAEGIGLGLIAYAVLHLATGRAKQASPLTYILALIFSLHLLRATLARLP
jgi:AGZA family xanthine/uracil permease-like MFS transporter